MPASPPDAVDVYWRRGCPYCTTLLRSLRRTEIPVRLHDIWKDDAAAATVRRVARGNETVPTVIVGERALVNPSMGALVSVLEEVAPHLVPDEAPRRRFGQG